MFYRILIVCCCAALTNFAGCRENYPSNSPSVNLMNATDTQDLDSTKTGPANELGFAKISKRQGDEYMEGIVDAKGKAILEPHAQILVNDIAGDRALLQWGRKFVFVPLNQGSVTQAILETAKSYDYAQPYSCRLALVMNSDRWFYIDESGQQAIADTFDFAEPFLEDRALVKSGERFRIIDTSGKTVSEIDFDQVSPQSPFCWQVIRIQDGKYLSGFIDRQGKLITEVSFDEVGYYDPEVKRIRVGRADKYGFLDERAQIAIPLQYDYAEIFSQGKARVGIGERRFFIDPQGAEISD